MATALPRPAGSCAVALGEERLGAGRLVAGPVGVLDGARQMPWSRLQRLLISAGIAELLGLHDALAAVGDIDPADIAYCRERLALPPEELNPPPLLTGDDLIALGIPRGKIYARLLEQLRDAQLDGRVATKDEARALARALARAWDRES